MPLRVGKAERLVEETWCRQRELGTCCFAFTKRWMGYTCAIPAVLALWKCLLVCLTCYLAEHSGLTTKSRLYSEGNKWHFYAEILRLQLSGQVQR